MSKSDDLKKLVHALQKKIKENSLDDKAVGDAIKQLEGIGYKYDAKLFPELPDNTNEFNAFISSTPNSLAEALLWKMGKWDIYTNFVKNYKSDDSLTSKTDVVFAAFAKHLKNKEIPIYDQHALRALWAINLNLKDQEKCKAVLFNSKGKKEGKWKQRLKGTYTIECYELYVKELDSLSNKFSLNKNTLDKLLMPLGQALKDNTGNFSDFEKLCWG